MAADTATVPVIRAGVGHWELVGEGSEASFSVRNFGLVQVHGSVPLLAAEAEVDLAGRISRAELRLDLSRVDTGQHRRDSDLRKPALLDLDRYPELVVRAGPSQARPEGFVLPGRLHARGTSVPVTLTATVLESSDDDAVMLITTTIDRRDLGIRAPRLLIGQRVDVSVRTRWRRTAGADPDRG